MTDTNSEPTTFHGPEAPVRTYLTTDVVTIAPTATVREAAEAITGSSVGLLVIGTADDVISVVSERDIVRAVAEGRDLDSVSVADIGTVTLVWAGADDTIGEAAEEMMEDYVRHVLVRDDQGLVGVLSIRDALSAFIT